VQQAMTAGAGVVRSAKSLLEASGALDEVADDARKELAAEGSVATGGDANGVGELLNLLAVGRALLCSASERLESRGSHIRKEYPRSDPAFRIRLVHNRGGAAGPGAEA
jgi:L-aspartate oxidase